jgi:uncharacterized protein (TIGR02246 family)
MTSRPRRIALAVVALVAATAVTVPAVVMADGGGRPDCAEELDAAIAAFDAAFAARDFDTYMAFYVDDAVQVDSQGNVYDGKEAIAGFVSAVMRNAYTFEAEVLSVTRTQCRAASVVEDSVFAVPAANFELRLIDGVSWVREQGQWKVTLVQNTVVPSASASPAA